MAFFPPKELLHNLLMGFPPVKRYAAKKHSTGLGVSSTGQELKGTFDDLVLLEPIEGKRILDVGPGQYIPLGRLAVEGKAASYTGIDVTRYISDEEARDAGIRYDLYDGRELPYEEGSFDLCWSLGTFEHIRHPPVTVREIHRVLTPGGKMICRVDLRDHYLMHDESRWLNCLKYPDWLWRAMTSNRSAYVNRLRFSDWKKLFAAAGFEIVDWKVERSEILRDLKEKRSYLRQFESEDVEVYHFQAILRKG